MKKCLLSVLLSLCFIAAPVFAIEWGGILRDETGVSRTEIDKFSDLSTYTFNQSNSLYFWVNKAFTEDSSWYLSTEGLYKYKLTFIKDVSPSMLNIVDLDLFKVTGQVLSGKNVFNLAAGRFFVCDNTYSIFAQTCDGISLKYSFPFMDTAVYAGYTGLLNSLNVTMLDETSYATSRIGNNSQVYALSHAYVPLIVSAEFPTFAGVQTLGVQASAFFDLNQETKYNRYYADLMMKGPIVASLFYTVNTTFGFPNFSGVSNYTDLSISGYGKDRLAVYVFVKYASGNNLFLKSFRGVSSCPAYSGLSEPELSGVLIPGLKTIIAAKMVDFNIAGKAVFACPEEKLSFSGIELDLGSVVNVFSDLQLSMTFTGYYDFSSDNTIAENGDVIVNTGDSYYKLNFNMSFAF